MQDAGYRDIGYKIKIQDYGIQQTGYRIHETGHITQEKVSRIQDICILNTTYGTLGYST